MPKIQAEIIQSVFYLYNDKRSAELGMDAQGTGFLVATLGQAVHHVYGVTNKHVACRGASVIRLNTSKGVKVFDFGPEDWESHPDGDDVAAVPINLDWWNYQVAAIPIRLFVPEDSTDIFVGDDVFMIGLFVDHEGREKNNPLVRFGNLSMLASNDTPIRHGNFLQESHIVDMHSRSGFSGSPVFVYRTFGSNLTNRAEERIDIDMNPLIDRMDPVRGNSRDGRPVETRVFPQSVFHLLGIHWAQFPEKWELKNLEVVKEESSNARYLVTDKTYVDGVSGMTCVVPAKKILQLLRIQKFLDWEASEDDDHLTRLAQIREQRNRQ